MTEREKVESFLKDFHRLTDNARLVNKNPNDPDTYGSEKKINNTDAVIAYYASDCTVKISNEIAYSTNSNSVPGTHPLRDVIENFIGREPKMGRYYEFDYLDLKNGNLLITLAGRCELSLYGDHDFMETFIVNTAAEPFQIKEHLYCSTFDYDRISQKKPR